MCISMTIFILSRVYYKEAVGAFIVFDVTRQATFDAVKKWKQDLDSKVQLPDGSTIPCMLLANKVGKIKIAAHLSPDCLRALIIYFSRSVTRKRRASVRTPVRWTSL